MKNVIIGTAGHVDHGKTALIKALTGIDTDRLEEEKKRGITIELGFAHLDFEDGTRAGIIDVPGHEKFIRNMLAGAGGVDLAMLIVAADEGIMPQTAEHLGILTLLGIRDGLVVVTKTDLVEDDWLEMVTGDVKDFVKGTFLDGKPVVPVSAYTGAGLKELKERLRALIDGVTEKNARVPFRLPVDRIFPVDGFGTVVTGTMIEGVASVGDLAELLPSGQPVTIRNIQVHGKTVPSAYAGQRTALNLAGVKKSEIEKGDVVAKRGTVRTSEMLDVRLSVLRDSKRSVKNASRLHLYHGARVVLAKAVLLDREELLPGDSCFAQLRLTDRLSSKSGDRFVVRFYSPLETVGGGVILDPDPPKRRRNDPDALEALKVRESGSAGDRIYQAAVKSAGVAPYEALRRQLDMDEEEFARETQALAGQGRLVELLPGSVIADAVLDELSSRCAGLLTRYHKEHPLHAGLRVAELRQKLLGNADTAAGNAVLNELSREGIIKVEDSRAALPGFEVRLTKRQQAIRGRILEAYRTAGYETVSQEEFISMLAPDEKKDGAPVFENLLASGELVLLAPQIVWHKQTFETARAAAEAHFSQNSELTMPQFRDMLGTSRKYAMAMLDYLDSMRVTRKTGDIRTLFRGFGMLT